MTESYELIPPPERALQTMQDYFEDAQQGLEQFMAGDYFLQVCAERGKTPLELCDDPVGYWDALSEASYRWRGDVDTEYGRLDEDEQMTFDLGRAYLWELSAATPDALLIQEEISKKNREYIEKAPFNMMKERLSYFNRCVLDVAGQFPSIKLTGLFNHLATVAQETLGDRPGDAHELGKILHGMQNENGFTQILDALKKAGERDYWRTTIAQDRFAGDLSITDPVAGLLNVDVKTKYDVKKGGRPTGHQRFTIAEDGLVTIAEFFDPNDFDGYMHLPPAMIYKYALRLNSLLADVGKAVAKRTANGRPDTR